MRKQFTARFLVDAGSIDVFSQGFIRRHGGVMSGRGIIVGPYPYPVKISVNIPNAWLDNVSGELILGEGNKAYIGEGFHCFQNDDGSMKKGIKTAWKALDEIAAGSKRRRGAICIRTGGDGEFHPEITIDRIN